MATLLESLNGMFGADTIANLGKSLGTDSSEITKALGAAGPLLLGGMARMASTPSGAESLFNMAKEHGGGILGSLGSLFGGVFGGGGAAAGPTGLLSSLLGSGANAIGASLSKMLGFNVGPLLAGAAPALLGVVSKAISSQHLDASGLASTLKKEHDDFVADPANKSAMEIANAARAVGAEADALIQSYGADWAKVEAGPVAALFMVASADPSGPIGSMKEVGAVGEKLLEVAKDAEPTSVLCAAFGNGLTVEMVRQLRSVAPSKDDLLSTITGAAAAVSAKSPGEARAYKDAIYAVAEAAAKASKEGGFLGFGGTLVSKDEQAALDKLKTALA
jgi:hypothetical protein